MVHKPKHKVHSFKGLLADGGQEEINLERQNVNLAYRIVKFELFPYQYGQGANEQESVVKIYKEEQSSVDRAANFSDPDLLAAAALNQDSTAEAQPSILTVVFDNTLFSRNIWVTHENGHSDNTSCNYYIELEEVPVTASTLMQLKLGAARKLIGGSMGK